MFISKLIDKRIAKYQQNLINVHYSEVENMYEKMRGWRHDYQKHIQVMKAHAQNGDIDAITQYLNELGADLQKVDNIIKTGNKMADAILNSKISFAISQHINVQVDVNIAIELTTSQIDLCIILGNLVDNAVEACLALPQNQRIIRIFMELKNTQLYISVTNSTAEGKLNKLSGRFKTTKGDGHGFGLARIDNIVERHNGYINRNSESGVFTTEILLPQG